MADEIIIEGLEEHAFRRSIESMLRHGRADEAAERLKALLPDLAGTILPARLLEITSKDLTFTGWDKISAKLEEYGRGETPITAIGIGICDPEDSGAIPDEYGNLRPPLETTWYSDATYPFSQTDREDLLEGYSSFGCEWQGDHDRADHALAIEGIDDIYGAIAALETKVANSERPSSQDIRAGAVGACYLGVLVFQALREAVIQHGLPRPLAILLVNSDAYPFFDAPVLTCDEYLDNGEVQVIERISAAVSSSRAIEAEAQEPEQLGSLIDMGMSGVKAGARKKMALALEGDEAANPLGMADELVAEAAFNPTTFDYSRFMPKISAPQDQEPDATPPHWADEPIAPEDAPEAEYPVDARMPESDSPAPDPMEETCDDTLGHAGYSANETAPAPVWPEPTAWQDAPEPDPESAAETVFSTHEPAQASAQSEEPPMPQPAGHSLRSRIRIAPIEEEVPSAMDKLQGSFAQFFKRVKEMLLRR